MDVNNLIALGAMVVALGSLAVSFNQVKISHDHNRRSIQPILRLRQRRNLDGSEAGLRLVNYGLGPAIITGCMVTLDDQPIGRWSFEAFELVTAGIATIPKVVTLNDHDSTVLPAGQEIYLLRLDDFDLDDQAWFWNLITERLKFEIEYESVYGGEGLKVARLPLTPEALRASTIARAASRRTV